MPQNKNYLNFMPKLGFVGNAQFFITQLTDLLCHAITQFFLYKIIWHVLAASRVVAAIPPLGGLDQPLQALL